MGIPFPAVCLFHPGASWGIPFWPIPAMSVPDAPPGLADLLRRHGALDDQPSGRRVPGRQHVAASAVEISAER